MLRQFVESSRGEQIVCTQRGAALCAAPLARIVLTRYDTTFTLHAFTRKHCESFHSREYVNLHIVALEFGDLSYIQTGIDRVDESLIPGQHDT